VISVCREAIQVVTVRNLTARFVRCGQVLLVCALLWMGVTSACAAELRVVDAAGLVRALKVVKGPARIVITLQPVSGQGSSAVVRGECVAVNIDGLAAEKKTQANSRGECIFEQMSEGSWQIRVPEKVTWRTQVYE
jgi:hypothetical protein